MPGRPPALLPGELGSLPLPSGRDQRTAIRAAIEEGLSEAISRIAGWRLDDVVPALHGRDGKVAVASWPGRLRGLLERNRVTSWTQLAELSLNNVMAWPGAGPAIAALLVARLIEAAFTALNDDVPDDPSWLESATSSTGDVSLLLGHERRTGATRCGSPSSASRPPSTLRA